MAAHGMPPIDLVVVNLYAFEATVAKGGDFATCIENIDIGGPSMIRRWKRVPGRRREPAARHSPSTHATTPQLGEEPRGRDDRVVARAVCRAAR